MILKTTIETAKSVKPSYKGALMKEFSMNPKEFAKYINPIIAKNRNITGRSLLKHLAAFSVIFQQAK